MSGPAVDSAHHGALPGETEHRLAGFTELVATTIANTQAREELRMLADEQAALLRADQTLVGRYDTGGWVTGMPAGARTASRWRVRGPGSAAAT